MNMTNNPALRFRNTLENLQSRNPELSMPVEYGFLCFNFIQDISYKWTITTHEYH